MARNTCPICGKKCFGDFCVQHKPRNPIPVKRKNKEYVNKSSHGMLEFFQEIWKERPHVSEISGEKIHTFSPAFCHHILHKETHEEAMFDKENIILLTLQEHDKVHTNPYFNEEINRRREELKIKYNIL